MSKQLSFSVANILSGHIPPSYLQEGMQDKGDHHFRSWSLSSCDSTGTETCTEAREPSQTDKRGSPPLSPVSTASDLSPITDIVSDELREEDSSGFQNDNDILTKTSLVKPTSKQMSQRRGRMRFSPEQIQTLERRFQEQHYLLPADRRLLAVALRMTERQVKTWFQNKRAQYKRSRCMLPIPIFHPMFAPSAFNYGLLATFRPSLPYPSLQDCIHSRQQMCSPMVIAATAVYPTSPSELAPRLANPIQSQPLTTLHAP